MVHALPKARLNEIARRKLESMGLRVHLDPNTQSLYGTFDGTGAVVVHPRTGQPISGSRFRVEGHNTLVFEAPPVLASLGPVIFYEFDQPALLLQRVGEQLRRRFAAVRQLHDRLRRYGFACEMDDDRAAVVARVELVGLGTVVLEGDDRGVVARTLLPVHQSGRRLQMGDVPVSLDEFPDRSDLELALSQYAEQALQRGQEVPAAGAPQSGGAATTRALEPLAPPSGAVTLDDLVRRLGRGWVMMPDGALARAWRYGADTVTLRLELRSGGQVEGRLVAGQRLLWNDRFAIADFPGAEALLASVLGVDAVQPDGAPPAGGHGQLPHSGVGLPVPGEIWVMGIQVVEDDGLRVKYVTIDGEGQRFGAPRELARDAFVQHFVPMGGAFYRLLVRVVEVSGDTVVYQHLDAKRQAVGDQRQIDLRSFTSTFVAEAAAY